MMNISRFVNNAITGGDEWLSTPRTILHGICTEYLVAYEKSEKADFNNPDIILADCARQFNKD